MEQRLHLKILSLQKKNTITSRKKKRIFVISISDFILSNSDYILSDSDFIIPDSDFVISDFNFVISNCGFAVSDTDLANKKNKRFKWFS